MSETKNQQSKQINEHGHQNEPPKKGQNPNDPQNHPHDPKHHQQDKDREKPPAR